MTNRSNLIVTTALALLAFAAPAMATQPTWYIPAYRFNTCDKVGEHIIGARTPQDIQDVMKRAGIDLELQRLSPGVVQLRGADNGEDNPTMITFFDNRAGCEESLRAYEALRHHVQS